MSHTPDFEHTTISNGGENTDSWDHTKINNSFDPLVIMDAVEQADKYWEMREIWEPAVETFIRSTQASLSQAWSGPAAEQSKQAIQKYIDDHARPVTPALEMLSSGIRKAAEHISTTKNSLPETIHVDGTVERWWNEWQNDDEISRRTQEARLAMSTNYVAPFGQLDSEVPVIPVPVGPTSTSDIPKPPPGGYSTDSGNPSTTTAGDSSGGGPGANPSGEGPDVPGEESRTEAPGEDQPGLPTAPGETPPTTAAGTEPAGTTTPTLAAGTSPAGVSTGPGALGAPGGAPSGVPGAGTSGAPGSPDAPGRSVPGAPGAPGGPQGAPAAGPAAANAAGSRGMGGMPMGGAGRGGGGQENEANRETPDYLINQENTDELLGETPPAVPGGVIGETPT